MYYYTYSSSSTYIILRQQLTKAQLEDAALLAQLQQEGMKIDLASGYSFFVMAWLTHTFFCPCASLYPYHTSPSHSFLIISEVVSEVWQEQKIKTAIEEKGLRPELPDDLDDDVRHILEAAWSALPSDRQNC